MKQIPQEILNAYAMDACYPSEHMDAIIEAARWANPSGILDVGTHYGSSAVHLQNAFPEALVITIGDEVARGGWVPGSFDTARSRFEAAGMLDKIIVIESDTQMCKPFLETALTPQRIAKAFQSRMDEHEPLLNIWIDFVFLDACHAYDGLMHEYHCYEDFLSERHCLVADDTTEEGVCRFSVEMVRCGYRLEVGTTFKGLAILKKE